MQLQKIDEKNQAIFRNFRKLEVVISNTNKRPRENKATRNF